MAILRAALLLVLCGVGGYIGWHTGNWYTQLDPIKKYIGDNGRLVTLSQFGFLAIGVLGGGLANTKVINYITHLAKNLREMPANDKIALCIGALIGLLATFLLHPIFNTMETSLRVILMIGVALVMVFLTTQASLSMRDELRRLLPGGTDEKLVMNQAKILDTNIIIDGRISDICRTRFIEGTLYVPGFVLDELQTIADSGDSLKRARGRRGLDILNAMQKEFSLVVRTHDHLLGRADGEPVDSKLVRLAKVLEGTIVTNDFNLNKVAELQGVPVMNVNELANSLKPVVLPGEELRVLVVKDGKEPRQGVAYLDDGTMVVIENAQDHVGDTVSVLVSSVLQTSNGKMIFGGMKDVVDQERDLMDRNLRQYVRDRERPRRDTRGPGGGPRQ